MDAIRIRLKRRRYRNRMADVICCPACLAHYGEGYGPLEGGRLSGVVRYHDGGHR